MKLIFPFIIFSFLLNNAFGQNYSSELNFADQKYLERRYQEALKVYESIESKKSNKSQLDLKIANCYYELRDLFEANYWFKKALEKKITLDQQSYSNYVQSLFSLNDINALDSLINNSSKANNENYFPVLVLQSLSEIEKFTIDSLVYSVKETNLNTGYSEISPKYFKNHLVYATNSKFSFNINLGSKSIDNKKFLDICYGTISKDQPNNICDIKNFSKILNTVYHDGPADFFDNERQIIYSSSNSRKNKSAIIPMGLFTAKYDSIKDKWTDINTFPYNSDIYNITHPAISENGRTLVFSSDMPGGYGKSDLYISEFNNGQWSIPINLGETINTKGSEMFPTINEGMLYFSSDGLLGLGGIDLYKISLPNRKSEKPENLGYPINTSYDDFSITLDNLHHEGYFTSNRNGSDDILSFKQKNRILQLNISESKLTALRKSEMIKFISTEKEIILPYSQDSTGYKVFIPVNAEVDVVVSRVGFLSSTLELEAGYMKEHRNLALTRREKTKVEIISIPKIGQRHEIVLQFNNELLNFEMEDSIWLGVKKEVGQRKMDSLLLSKNINIELRVQIAKKLVAYSVIEMDHLDYANRIFTSSDSVRINLISKLILKDPTVSLRMKTSEHPFAIENGIHHLGILRNNLITTVSVKSLNDIGIVLDDRHMLLSQTTLKDLSYKIMIGAFAIHRTQDFSYLADLGAQQQYLGPKTGLTLFYLNADRYNEATNKKMIAIDRGIKDAVLYFYYKGDFKWVHQIIKIIKEKDKDLVEKIRKDYNIYYKWYNTKGELSS